MKKLFYLLFVFPLLFSCGDNSSDDATPSAKAQAQEPKELGYKMYIEINDYDSFKDVDFLYEMCEKNNISTIDDFIKIYGYPNEVYADEYTMAFSWHGLIKTNIKHFSFRNVNSGEYKEAWMNEMKGIRYVYNDVDFIAFSFGTDNDDWSISSGVFPSTQNNREVVKDKNQIKGNHPDDFF